MMEKCDEVRERLTTAASRQLTPGLRRHLDDCRACRRFAERLSTARQYFKDHHANVEPEPSFAARVAERLPGKPIDLLGWAALRLLPATVALAVVLAWFALQTAPYAEANGAQAPTDDLLSWILEQPEVEP